MHNLTGDALELYARHQGLPSPLLDWSQSPFVAAYFACKEALDNGNSTPAIIALDRSRLPTDLPGIELIDDYDLLGFNQRALHQRGVFMRVSTITEATEGLLGDALMKFTIPNEEATLALAELDQMTINSTYLFADAAAAAETARLRVQTRRP